MDTDAAAPIATPLRDPEFVRIRRLAHQQFGLDLKPGKEALVAARLGKAMRDNGFESFRRYYEHVVGDGTGAALENFANALTTNFTAFLREPEHFSFLSKALPPALYKTGPVEVWSAAASTGEEPYSILFTILDALGPEARVHVLATDLSTRALARVKAGIYSAESAEVLPDSWLHRYFLKGNNRWLGWYCVKPEFQALVTADRFNLMSASGPGGRFPVIFCRNVMIYFDKPTRQRVVHMLSASLQPGGYLFIGHAESLTGVRHELEYVEPSIYRSRAVPRAGGRR